MKYDILDCTLRDGGYYTQWNFSSDLVETYLKAISKTPVKYVELGYLSDSDDSNGLYFHLNTKTLRTAKKILNKNQKISVMINSKEIKNSNKLIRLIKNNSKYIDNIRFAIDLEKLDNLKKIINARKKFSNISFNLNLMYLSKWIDNIEYAKKKINFLKNKCDIISLVDSYGALKPNQIYNFIKKIYTNGLKLGCHFHNNCGLALANSYAALDAGCKLVDTTILGMGRGAGNAETELLLAANHSKEMKISGFEFNTLLEKFEKMKINMKWGSSYAYAYAASNGYSQNQMMDLIQKKRLNVGLALKTISTKLNSKNKVKFENYNQFKKPKSIPLLIGGASSFKKFGKDLIENLQTDQPVILSGSNALSNFYELKLKIKNPIILIISGSELEKIKSLQSDKKFSLSKITLMLMEKEFYKNEKFLKTKFNRIAFSSSIGLNPLLLTGLFLLKLKIKKLNLAFFDGQPETEKGRIVMAETQDSLQTLQNKGLQVVSLTKTFLDIDKKNPWIQ